LALLWSTSRASSAEPLKRSTSCAHAASSNKATVPSSATCHLQPAADPQHPQHLQLQHRAPT
jgi:hypothetical protein